MQLGLTFLGIHARIIMASSGGDSCMVVIIAADIKPTSYRLEYDGVYSGIYKQLLKTSDLIDSRCSRKTLPHMHAVGLAKLVPGTFSDGVCTTWTPQEYLWWTCMRFADDVVSYRVVDCSKANIPAPIISDY